MNGGCGYGDRTHASKIMHDKHAMTSKANHSRPDRLGKHLLQKWLASISALSPVIPDDAVPIKLKQRVIISSYPEKYLQGLLKRPPKLPPAVRGTPELVHDVGLHCRCEDSRRTLQGVHKKAGHPVQWVSKEENPRTQCIRQKHKDCPPLRAFIAAKDKCSAGMRMSPFSQM